MFRRISRQQVGDVQVRRHRVKSKLTAAELKKRGNAGCGFWVAFASAVTSGIIAAVHKTKGMITIALGVDEPTPGSKEKWVLLRKADQEN